MSPTDGRAALVRLRNGGIGIYGGTAASFACAAAKAAKGIACSSAMSLTMAAYYLTLGLMRAGIALSWRRLPPDGRGRGAARCYRRTAFALFFLNLTMGAVILFLVGQGTQTVYPGYTIYASATFTFYMMGLAVVGLVKYRKCGDPVLSASKALNFVAALMSLLGLQDALIQAFSDSDDSWRIMMDTLTGTGVYLAVTATAVVMTVRAVRMTAEGKSR